LLSPWSAARGSEAPISFFTTASPILLIALDLGASVVYAVALD
jgi:hypothetical protein